MSENAEGDIVLGSRRIIDTTLHEEFTPIKDLNDISTVGLSGLPLGCVLRNARSYLNQYKNWGVENQTFRSWRMMGAHVHYCMNKFDLEHML